MTIVFVCCRVDVDAIVVRACNVYGYAYLAVFIAALVHLTLVFLMENDRSCSVGDVGDGIRMTLSTFKIVVLSTYSRWSSMLPVKVDCCSVRHIECSAVIVDSIFLYVSVRLQGKLWWKRCIRWHRCIAHVFNE